MTVAIGSISKAFNLADFGTPSQAASAKQFAVLAGLLGPLLAGALAAALHVWLRKRSLKWGLVFMTVSLPSYAAVAVLAGLMSLFTT